MASENSISYLRKKGATSLKDAGQYGRISEAAFSSIDIKEGPCPFCGKQALKTHDGYKHQRQYKETTYCK